MKRVATLAAILVLTGLTIFCSLAAAASGEPSVPGLTPAEKQWLESHRVVRVRVSSHYPPFIFMENGAARGMGYDYLQTLLARLNLRMVHTRPMSWTEAQENLAAGRGIDLQPVMVRSAERAAHMAFTRDYLTFPLVIFTRKKADFVGTMQDLAGKAVAMEKGYIYGKWIARDFPAVRLLETADSEEALKAVATGRADAYMGNLAVGSYLIENKGLANIKVAAPAPYGPAGLAMAVRKDWAPLATAIDKALAAMPPQEHVAIRNKWLTVRYEYGISPARILRWGLLAGGGLLAVFFLVMVWVRRWKREVADRRLAEEALKENEALFRQLTENIEEVFWIVSPDWTKVLYVSPAYEKIWGRSCHSLYEKPATWQETVVEEDRKEVGAYLQQKIGGEWGEIEFPEYRIQRPDGTIRWIRARGFPVGDDQGNVVRVVGIAEDVTPRKLAASQQEEYLRLLENRAWIDGIIRQASDPKQMMRDVLEALLKMFGSDRAWLLFPCDPAAETWSIPMECCRPEFPGALDQGATVPANVEGKEILRKCLATDGPVAIDPDSEWQLPAEISERFSIRSQLVMAIYPKNGKPWMVGMHQCSFDRIWTEPDARLFLDAGHRIADALSSFLSLKNLRESEERYRRLYEKSKRGEDLYRGLLNSSPDAIIQYDMAGNVRYVSPAFTDLFGWRLEEVAGKPLDFVPESEREASMEIVLDLMENGTPCSGFESRRYTKDGDLLTVSISGSRYHDHQGNPVGMLSIIRDISETKRLETQFQQSQRLEAIGTLAGGIAHDFNNLLMGIQGRCSLMMAGVDPRSENHEHLQGIESYVKSAADLTRQLLGFARGGRYEVKSTDLNELIKAQNRMFGRTRKEITIRGKYEKNLWPVEVDRGQFRQALLNFYVNAWHAMPGGGSLFVYTENVALSSRDAQEHNAAPGRYAKIIITDTGVGMDKETQRRVFEPFFTTREMGRGTGLGLASAYGIIKNHGGFITVYSEKGGGTTFNIYLPASQKSVVEDPVASGTVTRGHGRLLLVDDEKMILEVGRQMLEAIGYEVVTAASGEEALAAYRDDGDRIDLVILDMIMPEMGGSETFDRLRDLDPGVRVILSSGYSIDGQAAEIIDRGCRGFLQKPFDMEQLSTKIHDTLQEGPS